MKKRISYMAIVIIIAFISNNMVYNLIADETELSEKKAEEIISKHIKYGIYPVKIGEFDLTGKQADKYKKVLIKLKEKEIVTFNIIDTDDSTENFSKLYKFKVELTDKGKKSYYLSTEGVNIAGIIVGERKILEITENDGNDSIVYFAYSFEPNDIGYAIGSTKDNKNRGKAKLYYNKSVKKYIFDDFQFLSPLTFGYWISSSWVYERDGEKYFSAKAMIKHLYSSCNDRKKTKKHFLDGEVPGTSVRLTPPNGFVKANLESLRKEIQMRKKAEKKAEAEKKKAEKKADAEKKKAASEKKKAASEKKKAESEKKKFESELKEKDRRSVLALRRAGESDKSIAELLGISQNEVKRITDSSD